MFQCMNKVVAAFRKKSNHELYVVANSLFIKNKINVFFTKASNDFHLNAILSSVEKKSLRISYLDELEKAKSLVRSDLIYGSGLLEDAELWLGKVFDYNVVDGKKIRGTTVLKTYHALVQNENEIDFKLPSILGWCVEILQAYFLICDDIMDQSPMRRGKPCWYKNPEVGLCALNDALFLLHGIFTLLRKHFHTSENYLNMVEIFNKISEKTIYGQCLDMLSTPNNSRPKFDIFSIERYAAIVKHKTSYYTFCLPVHLSMYLVGKSSEEDFHETEQICFKLGLLFQIQDDFLDCFGKPEVIGKVGTDIQEGKCSWLAATLFEIAPESIKEEVKEIYGIDNAKLVSRVKEIYKSLSLESRFLKTQDCLHEETTSLIQRLKAENLKFFFYELLNDIYKRKK